MMQSKNVLKVTLTLVTVALASVGYLMAQPPAGGGGGGAPIDGGLSILLASGAAYGAKKLYNNHKAKKQDKE